MSYLIVYTIRKTRTNVRILCKKVKGWGCKIGELWHNAFAFGHRQCLFCRRSLFRLSIFPVRLGVAYTFTTGSPETQFLVGCRGETPHIKPPIKQPIGCVFTAKRLIVYGRRTTSALSFYLSVVVLCKVYVARGIHSIRFAQFG